MTEMARMIPEKMLIATNRTFGPPDVVQVVTVSTPIPKQNEILIRVFATTVSAADWRLRTKNVPRGFGIIMGLLFGFKKPKYQALGTEVAGEVVQVGSKVKNFKPGDRVVSSLGMKMGGHAQYIAVPNTFAIAKLPESVSYHDAAALVFGGTTALAFLRDKLKLKKGERLLVIGAGGSVGSAAVQIAKSMGAHVTAVCSQKKSELSKVLAADQWIYYEKEDWKSKLLQYDVILDTVGGTTLKTAKGRLNPNGRIGLVLADLPETILAGLTSLLNKQKAIAGSFECHSSDLSHLVSLCENGQFKPLIGANFSLDQIVQAHRLTETGHKTGNLVITIQA